MTTRQDQQLGKMLVGRNGHTLYMFSNDSGSKSSCTGNCAKTWLPDLTRGRPKVASGSGLNAKLLGTIRRNNGTKQVTYNHHPLYFYKADKNPGDTGGEQQYDFGGYWYAVGPNGSPLFNPGAY